jgi:hypothetical protein
VPFPEQFSGVGVTVKVKANRYIGANKIATAVNINFNLTISNYICQKIKHSNILAFAVRIRIN